MEKTKSYVSICGCCIGSFSHFTDNKYEYVGFGAVPER